MTRRGVRVELAVDDESLIKPGDGVVFDLGRPEEKEPGGRVWAVHEGQRKGGVRPLLLEFQAGAINPADIPVGCDVWKTDDPALRNDYGLPDFA